MGWVNLEEFKLKIMGWVNLEKFKQLKISLNNYLNTSFKFNNSILKFYVIVNLGVYSMLKK